jgi:hypothetical protein
MKNCYTSLCILIVSTLLVISCKEKKTPLITPSDEKPETTAHIKPIEKPIDYTKIDCDSIKKLFKWSSLLIGEPFENQLLEHYKCLNAQHEGKYQKEVAILSKYRGTSNEEKGLIMARDTLNKYALLNKRLEILQEDRRYMSHFFNDVAFVIMDTSFVETVPIYYDKMTKYRDITFPRYCRMINRKGKFLSKQKYQEILFMHDSKFIQTRKIMSWGLIDYKGNTVLPNKYREIGSILPNNTVTVRLRRKWSVVDLKGKALLKFRYNDEDEVLEAIKKFKK